HYQTSARLLLAGRANADFVDRVSPLGRNRRMTPAEADSRATVCQAVPNSPRNKDRHGFSVALSRSPPPAPDRVLLGQSSAAPAPCSAATHTSPERHFRRDRPEAKSRAVPVFPFARHPDRNVSPAIYFTLIFSP